MLRESGGIITPPSSDDGGDAKFSMTLDSDNYLRLTSVDEVSPDWLTDIKSVNLSITCDTIVSDLTQDIVEYNADGKYYKLNSKGISNEAVVTDGTQPSVVDNSGNIYNIAIVNNMFNVLPCTMTYNDEVVVLNVTGDVKNFSSIKFSYMDASHNTTDAICTGVYNASDKTLTLSGITKTDLTDKTVTTVMALDDANNIIQMFWVQS